MRSRRVAATAAVLGTAIFAAGSAAPAGATHFVYINTKVSITSNHNLTFSGKVSSVQPSCVFGRKVTLYRTGGLKLGSKVTGPSGKWKITVSGSAGISLAHFYAKVSERRDGTAGTIYVCRAAKSKTIKS